MKIKTEELKKFLSTASQIRINPLHPNLDFIKIECATNEIVFSKSNHNIHCTYKYTCAPDRPEILYIDERILNGIAATSHEYQISIEKKGDKIVITDGENVLRLPHVDEKLFPVIHKSDSEKYKLSKAIIDRIRIAARYISVSPLKTPFSFVEIGINGIIGTNGHITYYHNTIGLPESFFDNEVLNIIQPTDEAEFWSSESYDYFGYEGFEYGFIKTVIKPLPLMAVLNQPVGQIKFSFYKQSLLDFCIKVNYSTKSKYPIAVFSSENLNNLKLFFVDAEYSRDVTGEIQMQSSLPVSEFKFNVNLMTDLLKSLPYDQLVFQQLGVIQAQGMHYKITTPEDDGYAGIISKLG